MTSIPRFILRWGLISGLALGGATLLIGPDRVAAGLAQVRTKAQCVVDRVVDDPTVLRRQLEELADEYPQRIATVRGEIAEVNHQITQFERDSEVARRVVAIATDDLTDLKMLITRAQEVQSESVMRRVAVRFEGVRFNLDQARNEAMRINHIRINYDDRLATNYRQLDLLEQQKARLVDIAGRLQEEHSTFQTQMRQLDRQIDAIERNQRLIEMTEQLQVTLNGYDRWGKIDNLKQLEAKLAELRTIQQAQLDALAEMGVRSDYESRAKYQLEAGQSPNPFGDVIDETDSDHEADEAPTSFVWTGPIIIE